MQKLIFTYPTIAPSTFRTTTTTVAPSSSWRGFSFDIEIAVLVHGQFCESRWLAGGEMALVGVPAAWTTGGSEKSRDMLEERHVLWTG